ncbi:MAG TPA: hypothetical protein VF334_24020, partial [Polyangia bacterium]
MRLIATFTAVMGVASATLWGCTIDPGPDVGPPAGCNAPPGFFVTDVWPKYFQKYSCGQSDCHDAATGHGFFRLQDVSAVATPDPNSPVSTWPDQWQANFRAVQQNLSCSSPTGSAVLAVPSGRGTPHPAGDVVTDHASADA